MPELFSTESLISFVILVILEIVLGIDNVIFVSIIINKLKEADRKRARRVWMITGIVVRSILLFGLSWLLSQRGKPLFSVGGKGFDLASIVMIVGGLFLIYKSVKEIHGKLEGEDPDAVLSGKPKHISFSQAIVQLMVIDMVFSFDSVITAGGTAKFLEIMIAAVVIAMIVMFLFSPRIASFIHKHPTLKMLALSFLVMIGLSLVIEGWDHHKAEQLRLKNYIYFGMAFSFLVELLNMTMRKKTAKTRVVELNEPVLKTNNEGYSDSAH
jgi:predicted tellurium resistance membrane protein TerC